MADRFGRAPKTNWTRVLQTVTAVVVVLVVASFVLKVVALLVNFVVYAVLILLGVAFVRSVLRRRT